MRVAFLGVGEPWDENLHNVSIIVSGKDANILLDCGYDSYKSIFRYNKEANYLDAIYISHFHGDHDAGIPPLLSMLWVNDRTNPLTIIGQKGIKKRVMELIKIAHPELTPLLNTKYKLEFLETEATTYYKKFTLTFARTKHSVKNMAIRIEEDDSSVCYSGDGNPTKEAINLYSNSDLVIHDAYLYEQNTQTTGHGDIMSLIDMAEKNNVKKLAFVHVEKGLLSRKNKILKQFKNRRVKLVFPKEGGKITL